MRAENSAAERGEILVLAGLFSFSFGLASAACTIYARSPLNWPGLLFTTLWGISFGVYLGMLIGSRLTLNRSAPGDP